MTIRRELDSNRPRSTSSRKARFRPTLEGLEPRRLLTTWNGLGDGTTYDSGANWVGGAVPGPLDGAVIDVASDVTINLPASGLDVLTFTQTGGILVAPGGAFKVQMMTLDQCTFDDNGASNVKPIMTDSTLNLGAGAGTGDFSIIGTCTLNGQIAPGQTVDIGGDSNGESSSLTVTGSSTNLGTIFIGGGVGSTYTLICVGASPFTNLGVIECGGDLQGHFVNQGTIDSGSAGYGLNLMEGSSLVNESGGLYNAFGPSSFGDALDVMNGATFVNQAGGVVNAVGTIYDTTSSFVNEGTLAVVNNQNDPGSLTIDGTYTQTSTGSLDLALGGTTAGQLYDQFNVTGEVTLGGSLDVSLRNSFSPTDGEVFDVMNFGSVTGTFTTYNGTSLPDNLYLAPTLTSTGLTLTVAPVPQADLAVTVSAQPGQVILGGNVTYTVTLTNTGPDDAQGVGLSDILPSGGSVVSATASTGTPVTSGDNVTLSFATLANAATVTLTIVVTPSSTGNYTDNASVSDVSPLDPNLANNSASAAAKVVPVPSADLQVAVIGPGTTTTTGQLNFTVHVTNSGPNTASAATLTDTFTLPPGAILAAEYLAQGTFQVMGNVVKVTFGDIPAGTTLGLTVIVATTAAGTFADAASATSSTLDPNTANNLASTTLTVKGQATASLTPSASFALPGKPVTLTAQVSVPPGFVAATRSVTFYDGSTALGTMALDGSGHASIVVPGLARGTHSLTVAYSGDSNYATTTSAAIVVRVGDPVAGDFDGDGKADIAIYDATTATFFIQKSSGGSLVQPFGNPSHVNIPVMGDFDGDGKADIAIYDQSAATFYIQYSGGGSLVLPFGNPAHKNIPVAGDFDGLGKTDIAIYDQSAATFYILESNGKTITEPFGNPNHVNIPVAGDFDGDGKTDIAIFDQTAAIFYLQESGGGPGIVLPYGNPNHLNIPVAGDFDGDGKTDIAIYDETAATFYVQKSAGGSLIAQYGNPSDVNIPVPLDFDGDGKADFVIYDQSAAEFYALESAGGRLALPFGTGKHATTPV